MEKIRGLKIYSEKIRGLKILDLSEELPFDSKFEGVYDFLNFGVV